MPNNDIFKELATHLHRQQYVGNVFKHHSNIGIQNICHFHPELALQHVDPQATSRPYEEFVENLQHLEWQADQTQIVAMTRRADRSVNPIGVESDATLLTQDGRLILSQFKTPIAGSNYLNHIRPGLGDIRTYRVGQHELVNWCAQTVEVMHRGTPIQFHLVSFRDTLLYLLDNSKTEVSLVGDPTTVTVADSQLHVFVRNMVHNGDLIKHPLPEGVFARYGPLTEVGDLEIGSVPKVNALVCMQQTPEGVIILPAPAAKVLGGLPSVYEPHLGEIFLGWVSLKKQVILDALITLAVGVLVCKTILPAFLHTKYRLFSLIKEGKSLKYVAAYVTINLVTIIAIHQILVNLVG